MQRVVIRVGQLAGGAVELDLPEGTQRDGARTEVVVRIQLVSAGRSRLPARRNLEPEDGPQHEPHRESGEQHADDEFDHGRTSR